MERQNFQHLEKLSLGVCGVPVDSVGGHCGHGAGPISKLVIVDLLAIRLGEAIALQPYSRHWTLQHNS